ncbi:TWiK family of potassium channels protein 18-like isoform X2 [Cimex lectularius]|uniref:Potassium channel domain-containing protein n=1 Tax=Cimex lectularius TaxID=79782 RepID=A0A8I6RC16_CIMLE|nr:TWiK family of potassium channels protein 18-like isoform X2 [Cimex lectularius]
MKQMPTQRRENISYTKVNGNWEIKEKVENLKEIRYLLYLIQDAVAEVSYRCQDLTDSANALENDNVELKKKILVHHNYKRKDRLDMHTKFIGLREVKLKVTTPTKLLNLNKTLGKKKHLEKYLKNVHLWKKTAKYHRRIRKSISLKLREEFKSHYEEFKISENNNLHWTEKLIIYLNEYLTRSKNVMLFYILMCIAVILYTLLGAFVFRAVEGYYEQKLVNEVLEERAKLAKLDSVTDSLLNEYYDFLTEKFKINKYLFARGDELSWDLTGSIFFCATTCTTIGYGDITPVTTVGKILMMFYAFFGIPLFLILLGFVGETFANLINTTSDHILPLDPKGGKLDERQLEKNEKRRFKISGVSKRPMLIFFTVEIFYVLIGVKIFMSSEEHLHYLDSLYFTIITLYTIGFGDFILDRKFMLGCIMYIIGGLTLTSIGFSLVKKSLKRNVNSATYKLGRAVVLYLDQNHTESD